MSKMIPLRVLHDALTLKNQVGKTPEDILNVIFAIKESHNRNGLARCLRPIADRFIKENRQKFDARWLKLLSEEGVDFIDSCVWRFVCALKFPIEELDVFLRNSRDHIRLLFIINLLAFDRGDGHFTDDGRLVKDFEIDFVPFVAESEINFNWEDGCISDGAHVVEGLKINSWEVIDSPPVDEAAINTIRLAKMLSETFRFFIEKTKRQNIEKNGDNYPIYLYGFTALAGLVKASCVVDQEYDNDLNLYHFSQQEPDPFVDELVKEVGERLESYFESPTVNEMFDRIYYFGEEARKEENTQSSIQMYREWKEKLNRNRGTKCMLATGHKYDPEIRNYMERKDSIVLISDPEENSNIRLDEITENIWLIVRLLSRVKNPTDRAPRRNAPRQDSNYYNKWEVDYLKRRTLLHSEFCQNIAKWIGREDIEVN